jgi:hypothetical protein
MGVEVRYVLGQHGPKVAPVEYQHPIQQLRRTVPIHRSAIAFARGCSYRCAQYADVLAGEHGIEDVGELAVAIPDQESELSRAVAEIHQQVPCLLGDPGSRRVRGNAQEVHAAIDMLDHEQDVEPVKQQRVDAEEVRGKNAVCLGA